MSYNYVLAQCSPPSYTAANMPARPGSYCIQAEVNGTCPAGTSVTGQGTCSDWVNPCPPNASRVAINGVPNQACQCDEGYVTDPTSNYNACIPGGGMVPLGPNQDQPLKPIIPVGPTAPWARLIRPCKTTAKTPAHWKEPFSYLNGADYPTAPNPRCPPPPDPADNTILYVAAGVAVFLYLYYKK